MGNEERTITLFWRLSHQGY